MNQETIRCLIRRKDVQLTPEEEVRQRILSYMIQSLGYPAGLISVEQVVRVNKMNKRADIIVHDLAGEAWLLIECKRPSVVIDERTLAQIVMYNSILDAPYLLVSNGDENHILAIDREQKSVIRLKKMPVYPHI